MLERTVTITVNDRPHYLRRSLASLSRVRGINSWHLLVGLEPGNDECTELCKGIDFMPRTIVYNERRLGIRGNPYHLLCTAFERSLLNIYLEDDLLVSPDVAELALWYSRLIANDALYDIKVMFLNLFVTSTGREPAEDVVSTQFFSPWGLVVNRYQWINHLEPFWWNDHHSFPDMQDWTLSLAERMRYPLLALAPRLSRSTNIGREGGVHSDPQRHDLLMGGLVMNEEPGPHAYRINPEASVRWRRLDYRTMTVCDTG